MDRLFLSILFCSYVPCLYHHENPKDPLHLNENNVRNGPGRSTYGRKLGRDSEQIIEDPIVSTKNGQLNGYIMKTIKQRSIYAFEGIPYGEDTGGANRFKLPIPKAPWQGVRSAKKAGAHCLQLNPFRTVLTLIQISGSEDCLFLNIYTPKLPKNKGQTTKSLLPVIVWIHGGGFYLGAGHEYGPAYLLDHDLILVTINYRVGILGFITTGDEVIPPNLGLKDQALALKWVHENIKNFGGDPNRVTIAGQSAGAVSVHLHMISHVTRKYYNNAISMSGTGFMMEVVQSPKHAQINLEKIAKATNCHYRKGKHQNLANCLRGVNGNLLTVRQLMIFEVSYLPFFSIGPVIERESPTAFLTVDPATAYRTGIINKVPWLITRTSHEGNMMATGFSAFRLPSMSKRTFFKLAPTLIGFTYSVTSLEKTTRKICEFYLDNCIGKSLPPRGISDAITDAQFGLGIHKAMAEHSLVAPTYGAVYSYQGKNSFSGKLGLNPKEFGVSHNDDMDMVFNRSIQAPGYSTIDPDYAIVKLMTSLFYNFANSSEPFYTTEQGQQVRVWNPVKNSSDIKLLQIAEHVQMIDEPWQERLAFWKSILG